MTTILFPDFMHDAVEYAKAESLWQEEWKKLLRESKVSDTWQTPWINTVFGNGSPFRDGNPIFSAICPKRNIGLRVIQLQLEDDPGEFTSWNDTFADGESDQVSELVVACVLSAETLTKAMSQIRSWVQACTAAPSRQAS